MFACWAGCFWFCNLLFTQNKHGFVSIDRQYGMGAGYSVFKTRKINICMFVEDILQLARLWLSWTGGAWAPECPVFPFRYLNKWYPHVNQRWYEVRELKSSHQNRLHTRARTFSACELNFKMFILAFTVILHGWRYQGLMGNWRLREPRRVGKWRIAITIQ